DGVHTLAYKGMGVFDGYGANLPTQLWILARYMHGISFLVAPVFLRRSFRVSIVLSAYACVTALSLLSIFSWGIFPVCYVDSAGLTTFKVVSEYVISLIFLASLGMVIVHRQLFDAGLLRLICGAILFNIAAELAFSHYLGVYDFMNHLQVVFGLLDMGDGEEARQYIERVYGDIQRVGQALRTSIPAVNAL
ncbi:MAG TPA: MASE3 domain-containing protein, partial [Deltaproteobacteria bacterium]|nr:MASE3 domain-containing protein [Deltaproteobacteria bacterium]